MIQHLDFVSRYLADESQHRRIYRVPIRDSKLDEDTLRTLINIGIIEELQPHEAHLTVTTVAFLVKEVRKEKTRHRTIFHTIVDNHVAPSPPEGAMQVAPLSLLSARVRACEFAASRDFKSYFHQLLFSPLVSSFFVFKTPQGKKYRLCRAAMGHKSSPAAATAVTKALVHLALSTIGHKAKNVKYDIIIDDVMFLSPDKTTLEEVLEAFDSICKAHRVTIGSAQPVATSIIHRGIHFDLSAKTQRIKHDFIQKFLGRADFYTQKPTIERMKSLLGMVTYAGQVLYIKSLSATHRHVAKSLIQKPTGREFQDAIEEIRANTPQQLAPAQNAPFGGSICSDATPKRMAAMYADQYGNVSATASDNIEELPIHVSEARACILAASIIPQFKVAHVLDVHSDNLSWLFTVSQPGKIAHETMEEARQKFRDLMKEKNALPRFYYIRSSENPMDGPSRGTEMEVNTDAAKMLQKSTPLEEVKKKMREGHLREERK